MKLLWTRKSFLLIFVSLVCCCCKHASHSKDLFLAHVNIRGGESDRTWDHTGEEAALWEVQEGKLEQQLYACIFQSNEHIDFLIYHHPCFKFPREDANCWEEPVRHSNTTWHTQHGSIQQCRAWLLADLLNDLCLSAGMQGPTQVPHQPVEG